VGWAEDGLCSTFHIDLWAADRQSDKPDRKCKNFKGSKQALAEKNLKIYRLIKKKLLNTNRFEPS